MYPSGSVTLQYVERWRKVQEFMDMAYRQLFFILSSRSIVPPLDLMSSLTLVRCSVSRYEGRNSLRLMRNVSAALFLLVDLFSVTVGRENELC